MFQTEGRAAADFIRVREALRKVNADLDQYCIVELACVSGNQVQDKRLPVYNFTLNMAFVEVDKAIEDDLANRVDPKAPVLFPEMSFPFLTAALDHIIVSEAIDSTTNPLLVYMNGECAFAGRYIGKRRVYELSISVSAVPAETYDSWQRLPLNPETLGGRIFSDPEEKS